MIKNHKDKNQGTGINFVFTKYFLIIVGFILVIICIFLWKTQESKNLSYLISHTESNARTYASESETRFNNIYDALELMAKNSTPLEVNDSAEWRKDAQFYVDSFKGIKNIALLDKDSIVYEIVPLEGYDSYLNKKITEIYWSESDLNLLFPLYDGIELKGFILGVINAEEFVSPIISDIKKEYAIKITDEGKIVFTSEYWEDSRQDLVAINATTLKKTKVWNLYLSPSEELYKLEIGSTINIFLFSLLFSLIAMTALYFAQRSGKKSKLLQQNKEDLILYQAQLSREKEELRIIFSSIGDGIITTDSNRNVQKLNLVAEELTGWKSQEAFGRPFTEVFDIINPETGKRARDPVEDVLKTNQNCELENNTILISKSGLKRYVSDSAAPIKDNSGKTVGVVMTFRDVTKKKMLEGDLKKAMLAAEAANRSKSMFLSSMSHEMRTPMNAVLGFSQLLLRDSDLKPQQRDWIGTINRSGEHLLELINDNLDISKIEAGSITLNKTTFDINNLLFDMEEMFKERANAKGLNFNIEIDESLPRYIISDEGKVRQIFINLISNSVKFTKEGMVIVRVKAVVKSHGKLALMAEFEDSGCGIAEPEQDKLFKIFSQAENGKRQEGTGLGLFLSLQLANFMGGGITFKSQINKGSCFFLNIEIEKGSEKNVENIRNKVDIIGIKDCPEPIKVLIVDDNLESLEFLFEALKPLGLEIYKADDGLGAISKFEKYHPNLIFMDYKLPDINGLEVAKIIKTSKKGFSTKIIMVSASALSQDISKFNSPDLDAFIRKPYKINEIFDNISKIFKLKYIYKDDPKEDQSISEIKYRCVILPPELINKFKKAIKNAQIDNILELIQEVELLSPQFAEKLRVTANEFQYDALQKMIENQ